MLGYDREWEMFQERYRPVFYFLLYLSIGLIIVMFYSFVMAPDVMKKMVNTLTNSLSNKGMLQDNPSLTLSLKLFQNNALAALHSIWTGLVPVIFIPPLLLSMTMMAVGAILAFADFSGHDPFQMFLLGILPHGIFELTALVYAATVGTYVSIQMAKYFFLKRRIDFSERQLLLMCIGSYFRVVLPLLAIAALIEGLVTPILLR